MLSAVACVLRRYPAPFLFSQSEQMEARAGFGPAPNRIPNRVRLPKANGRGQRGFRDPPLRSDVPELLVTGSSDSDKRASRSFPWPRKVRISEKAQNDPEAPVLAATVDIRSGLCIPLADGSGGSICISVTYEMRVLPVSIPGRSRNTVRGLRSRLLAHARWCKLQGETASERGQISPGRNV